jgi:PEP-CTERM motif
MKLHSITKLSAVLAGCVLGTQSAPTAVTYAVGDLLMGFHTEAGQGSGTSFVLNLGQATNYRTAPTTLPPMSSIGPILESTFGLGWFSRNDLYWGIAAVRDAAAGGANTVVNGDPRATIYISMSASAPGNSVPWNLGAGSTTISTATSIATMQGASGSDLALSGGFEGSAEAAGTGGFGGLQDEGTFINDWHEFNPVGGSAFGTLSGGIQSALGGGPVEYLDLYRVVGRASAGDDPVGQGRYITTFSINSAGIVSAIPEPASILLLGLAMAAPLLRRRREIPWRS